MLVFRAWGVGDIERFEQQLAKRALGMMEMQGVFRAISSVRQSRDDRRVAVVAACVPSRRLQFRLPTLLGKKGVLSVALHVRGWCCGLSLDIQPFLHFRCRAQTQARQWRRPLHWIGTLARL